MKPSWIRLAGDCFGGDDCPSISLTDLGAIAVQGPRLDVVTPSNEAIVEIAPELLLEASRALASQ